MNKRIKKKIRKQKLLKMPEIRKLSETAGIKNERQLIRFLHDSRRAWEECIYD